MNLGLLIISVVLVVAGIASGFIPLIVLGAFLLLPALATGRRVRAASKREPSRRVETTETGPEPQQPATTVPEAPPAPSPQPTTNSGMLPPLFPTQIFPTLSPIQFETRKFDQVRQQDEIPVELLEMGAIFLLGRFLSKQRRRQPT